VFRNAASLGERIRLVETFAALPAEEFHRARLDGRPSSNMLGMPTPQRAFVADGVIGHISLLADRSLRIADVSTRSWNFAISGYPVIYRWLRARNGERIDAGLQRAMLDIVWRVEELLHLFDEADGILNLSLNGPLTRAQLGVARVVPPAAELEEED